MTDETAYDVQDQLEERLARASALLHLLSQSDGVDRQTLQSVAQDAADHVTQAQSLCQSLAETHKKGPALERQPLHAALSMHLVGARSPQRPPAAL